MGTCPHCGAELEYSAQTARVLTGTCGGCHQSSTILEAAVPLGSAPESVAPGPSPESSAPAEGGPECADCGSRLQVVARDDGTLEVSCAECETVTVFSSVPPRRGGAERGRTEAPGREGASRSRPCRQCGAPLSFSTAEDGTITGVCASCGNRFTLPPRRFGSGPGERRDRFGSRGPPRYGRSDRSWSGGPRRDGPRYPPRGRPRRERDDDSDSDDDSRRRRRPRRE